MLVRYENCGYLPNREMVRKIMKQSMFRAGEQTDRGVTLSHLNFRGWLLSNCVLLSKSLHS